jgi:hypothetical protein
MVTDVKQRGGSMKVSGWLTLTLLALSITEVALISHLYKHRTIKIVMPEPKITKVMIEELPMPDDSYSTKSFPVGRHVCTFADTICYTRI